MATIKSFTDLSQSKTLSTILPLESADMVYIATTNDDIGDYLYTAMHKSEFIIREDDEDCIPCWSLAALLNVLPYPILCKKSDNTWGVDLWVDNKFYCTYASYKIDACYEMILKLNELKML